MAAKKVEYDGYQFDLEDLPWDNKVTGRQFKDEIQKKAGTSPEGSIARITPDGRYEHIGADEPFEVKDGDRITSVPSFETAGN